MLLTDTELCINTRSMPLTVSTLELRYSSPAWVVFSVVRTLRMALNTTTWLQVAGEHNSTKTDSSKRLQTQSCCQYRTRRETFKPKPDILPSWPHQRRINNTETKTSCWQLKTKKKNLPDLTKRHIQNQQQGILLSTRNQEKELLIIPRSYQNETLETKSKTSRPHHTETLKTKNKTLCLSTENQEKELFIIPRSCQNETLETKTKTYCYQNLIKEKPSKSLEQDHQVWSCDQNPSHSTSCWPTHLEQSATVSPWPITVRIC